MSTPIVVDTNILLKDVSVLEKDSVYIPYVVLQELDKLKRCGSVEFEARRAIRAITASKALILTDFINDSVENNDDIILSCAKVNKATLHTDDACLTLKARAAGIEVEQFKDKDEIYNGYKTVTLTEEDMAYMYEHPEENMFDLYANQYLLVKDSSERVVDRLKWTDKLVALRLPSPKIIKPLNDLQAFAIDLLNDKDIPIKIIAGTYGGGKTICTLRLGLYHVVQKGNYSKLLIVRNPIGSGEEIGFIKGPQPLDAKILTPTGWVTMGSLKIGDYVISKNGNPVKVLNIFKKGIKQIYKVETTDGTSTECCEDHLWATTDFNERKHNKGYKIRTTKDIMSKLLYHTNNKLNFHIPRNKPVEFYDSDLPLDPYVLGVLLGDGSICNSISIYSTDNEIIEKVRIKVEQMQCSINNVGGIQYCISSNLRNNKPARHVQLTNLTNNKSILYYSIGEALEELDINRSSLQYMCDNNKIVDNVRYSFVQNNNRWQNKVKDILYNLGLLGKKCCDKFIPDQYKYNSSIDKRLELLRGLMDTDGTVSKEGNAVYYTTSKILAEDVADIVRSLGGRTKIRVRNRVTNGNLIDGRIIKGKLPSYELCISLPEDKNPFSLPRKADRYKCKTIRGVGIKSVTYVGDKETQCILIDDPEHLYITDGYIVTHNTKDEKIEPFYKAIEQNLDGGEIELQRMLQYRQLEFEIPFYLKGQSISNSFIIVEEAGDFDTKLIKLVGTRVAEGSCICFSGDWKQAEAKYSRDNGLVHLLNKTKDNPLVGAIILEEDVRSSASRVFAEL